MGEGGDGQSYLNALAKNNKKPSLTIWRTHKNIQINNIIMLKSKSQQSHVGDERRQKYITITEQQMLCFPYNVNNTT